MKREAQSLVNALVVAPQDIDKWTNETKLSEEERIRYIERWIDAWSEAEQFLFKALKLPPNQVHQSIVEVMRNAYRTLTTRPNLLKLSGQDFNKALDQILEERIPDPRQRQLWFERLFFCKIPSHLKSINLRWSELLEKFYKGQFALIAISDSKINDFMLIDLGHELPENAIQQARKTVLPFLTQLQINFNRAVAENNFNKATVFAYNFLSLISVESLSSNTGIQEIFSSLLILINQYLSHFYEVKKFEAFSSYLFFFLEELETDHLDLVNGFIEQIPWTDPKQSEWLKALAPPKGEYSIWTGTTKINDSLAWEVLKTYDPYDLADHAQHRLVAILENKINAIRSNPKSWKTDFSDISKLINSFEFYYGIEFNSAKSIQEFWEIENRIQNGKFIVLNTWSRRLAKDYPLSQVRTIVSKNIQKKVEELRSKKLNNFANAILYFCDDPNPDPNRTEIIYSELAKWIFKPDDKTPPDEPDWDGLAQALSEHFDATDKRQHFISFNKHIKSNLLATRKEKINPNLLEIFKKIESVSSKYPPGIWEIQNN